MTTQILKTCDTAWVIVNYGIPKLSTMRTTRRDCIAAFKHQNGWDAYEWEDARKAGTFVCVKVQLVPK